MKRHADILLLLCVFALAGCGGSDTLPPAALARSSLEKSLSTWRDGGRPGTIAGSEPAIEAVDSSWQAGRKLGKFEILREEGGEGDRRFDVRLNLDGKDEDVHYVVIGKGPVWVYRAEDYQKMINMENNPLPRKTAKRKR